MPWTIDARIPVRLGTLADATQDDALLIEGADIPPGAHPLARFVIASTDHVVGCACCAPHSEAARALNTLFQARAKGEVRFFRHVLAVTASPEGDLAVWAALRADPLVSGRFRAADAGDAA